MEVAQETANVNRVRGMILSEMAEKTGILWNGRVTLVVSLNRGLVSSL